MPYCTDCGFEIPPGTRFCPSCGSDQITVPAYEIKKSPSVLPLILGILGILSGFFIIPLIGLILGALGVVLAHTDKNKSGYAYMAVGILAIVVSLISWAFNFISLIGGL